MTIGIGLLCTDGVVLCSDRQITAAGEFKYDQRKIFSGGRGDCTFVFSYAGEQDSGSVIFVNLNDALPKMFQSGIRDPDRLRKGLETVYRGKNVKHLETLVGVHLGGQQVPVLFRTNGTKIVMGYSEYIGAGDSSVLRYLSELVFPSRLNAIEGVTLGSYLVSVANRFIDGCSGGPDTIILSRDGSFTSGSAGPWPNAKERIAHCEQQIGKGLRELLYAAGNGEVLVKPLSAQKSEPEP